MKDDDVKLIEIASAIIFTAVVIGAIAFTIAGAVIGIGLPALAAGIAAMGGIGTAFITGSSSDLVIRMVNLIKNSKAKKSKINRPFRYKLLNLTGFFFSTKTQKETFEQNMADWDYEIYKALQENKNASLFMINVRNTYAFLAAMWLKSPIGDLIQFVIKIAKQ